MDHFVVIREADEEAEGTEPALPLKGERRCGVRPSPKLVRHLGPVASFGRRPQAAC
jgi:hypothetical protein